MIPAPRSRPDAGRIVVRAARPMAGPDPQWPVHAIVRHPGAAQPSSVNTTTIEPKRFNTASSTQDSLRTHRTAKFLLRGSALHSLPDVRGNCVPLAADTGRLSAQF